MLLSQRNTNLLLLLSLYGWSGVYSFSVRTDTTSLSMKSSYLHMNAFSVKPSFLSREMMSKKRGVPTFLNPTVDGVTMDRSTAEDVTSGSSTSSTLLRQSWNNSEASVQSAASKSNLFSSVPTSGSSRNKVRSTFELSLSPTSGSESSMLSAASKSNLFSAVPITGSSKNKVGSALALSLSPKAGITSDLLSNRGGNVLQKRKLKSLMALATIFEDACTTKEEVMEEKDLYVAAEVEEQSEIERKRLDLINAYSESSDEGEKAFSMLLDLDMIDVHLDPEDKPLVTEPSSQVIPGDEDKNDEGHDHDDDKLEFEDYEESDPGVDHKEDEKEDQGEDEVVVIEDEFTNETSEEEDSNLDLDADEKIDGVQLRKRELIETYSQSDDLGERAFAMLLELGMVQLHLDPDDPLYDHEWDMLYSPDNNWIR